MLEIASHHFRGAFTVSLLAVTAAAVAAVWLFHIGHTAAPSPAKPVASILLTVFPGWAIGLP